MITHGVVEVTCTRLSLPALQSDRKCRVSVYLTREGERKRLARSICDEKTAVENEVQQPVHVKRSLDLNCMVDRVRR
jgi:hypothetical protein